MSCSLSPCVLQQWRLCAPSAFSRTCAFSLCCRYSCPIVLRALLLFEHSDTDDNDSLAEQEFSVVCREFNKRNMCVARATSLKHVTRLTPCACSLTNCIWTFLKMAQLKQKINTRLHFKAFTPKLMVIEMERLTSPSLRFGSSNQSRVSTSSSNLSSAQRRAQNDRPCMPIRRARISTAVFLVVT